MTEETKGNWSIVLLAVAIFLGIAVYGYFQEQGQRFTPQPQNSYRRPGSALQRLRERRAAAQRAPVETHTIFRQPLPAEPDYQQRWENQKQTRLLKSIESKLNEAELDRDLEQIRAGTYGTYGAH